MRKHLLAFVMSLLFLCCGTAGAQTFYFDVNFTATDFIGTDSGPPPASAVSGSLIYSVDETYATPPKLLQLDLAIAGQTYTGSISGYTKGYIIFSTEPDGTLNPGKNDFFLFEDSTGVTNFAYTTAGDTGIWYSNAITDDIKLLPGPPVATVPEPETYAILLAGFVLMGMAFHRQKRRPDSR